MYLHPKCENWFPIRQRRKLLIVENWKFAGGHSLEKLECFVEMLLIIGNLCYYFKAVFWCIFSEAIVFLVNLYYYLSTTILNNGDLYNDMSRTKIFDFKN